MQSSSEDFSAPPSLVCAVWQVDSDRLDRLRVGGMNVWLGPLEEGEVFGNVPILSTIVDGRDGGDVDVGDSERCERRASIGMSR